MILKKLTTLIFLSLITQSLWAANLIVISDIDDTIKNSHVADKEDAITNAFKTDTSMGVDGMSDLYQTILNENSGIKFYYVSNAPELIMDSSHREFLESNGFPFNRLFTRANILDDSYKEKIFETLINENDPQTVVMIGDNGEQDVYAQNAIVNKYKGSGIKFIQFIREPYSHNTVGSKLKTGQNGFITPGEIAIKIADEKLLKLNSAIQIAEKDMKKNKLNLISWVNCRDHRLIEQPKNSELNEVYKKLNKVVKDICSIE